MERHEMLALVETHLKAEGAGDIEGAVSVYTDDIVHDAVGIPGSPRTGKDAARDFYRFLTGAFRTEHEEPLRQYWSGDALTMEQLMTGTAVGEFMGLPGNGKRLTFRILHVFEFRDGLISRENVWVDGAVIAAQLTSDL